MMVAWCCFYHVLRHVKKVVRYKLGECTTTTQQLHLQLKGSPASPTCAAAAAVRRLPHTQRPVPSIAVLSGHLGDCVYAAGIADT